MTLAVVWHTWGPDAACLRESVEAVRAVAPWAALWIWHDPDSPLSREDCAWLVARGAKVRTSEAPHGGNLNGAEHAAQQLAHLDTAGRDARSRLDAIAAESLHAWVLKLDADTLVLNLDWLAAAAAGGALLAGFSLRDCALSGPCYAVRSDALPVMRQQLAAGAAAHLAPRIPEDLAAHACAMGAGLPARIVPAWTGEAAAGREYCGLNYTREAGRRILAGDARLSPYLSFCVVTCGNRHQLPGHETERRAAVARAMRTLREASAPGT